MVALAKNDSPCFFELLVYALVGFECVVCTSIRKEAECLRLPGVSYLLLIKFAICSALDFEMPWRCSMDNG